MDIAVKTGSCPAMPARQPKKNRECSRFFDFGKNASINVVTLALKITAHGNQAKLKSLA